MCVKVDILKGPLALNHLTAISRLYGQADPKYFSLDYCRQQFNENSYGYSYHALGYEGDVIISHFAIIPIQVRQGDRVCTGGKGEALFVTPEYRGTQEDIHGKPVILAVRMSQELQKRALADGVEMITMLSNTAVSAVHKIAGCREVKVQGTQFLLPITISSRSVKRRLMALFRQLQRLILKRISGGPATVQPIRHAHELLSPIPSLPAHTWSVHATPELFEWMIRKGPNHYWMLEDKLGTRIQFYYSGEKGATIEILDIACPHQGKVALVSLICHLIDFGQQQHVQAIRWLVWQSIPNDLNLIAAALRHLGFKQSTESWSLLVRPHCDMHFHYAMYLGF